MGNLPAIRVTPSPTFGIVGVDYTGHFWLRHGIRGKSRTKVYLALFVCMVTKAVHIEIVSSLTTEAFLMALKRFVSRRGIPTKIFSDNATTFVGANSRLHALYNLFKSLAFQKQIIDFCSNSSIDWTFIPPRSPHVGGIWEAGIKILKRHLLREIGEAVLSYEELLTTVTHVEAILNSRPLIRPTDDAAEFNYLTPAHFLIGRPLTALPDPNALQQQSVRCHWNQTQNALANIWTRWTKEYLLSLQQRSKWTAVSPNIKTGTPVLLIDDNLPPLEWRLGVITQTFPGRDGRTRTVQVQTNAGSFVRHIHRLCPLPIHD
ncbi:hypothetical protein R5R35_003962 [Gryllus longicercus]|uniref:Integrase catalytic domain-containing protein n=1 Tax=Gryllus longicercus TaxID=2509291 RepID=A0AAN9Z2Q2_9ORTH